MEYIDFITAPDIVLVQTEQEWVKLNKSGDGLWSHKDIELRTESLIGKLEFNRTGNEGESPFAAAKAFCAVMCEKPKIPEFPVYGGNSSFPYAAAWYIIHLK